MAAGRRAIVDEALAEMSENENLITLPRAARARDACADLNGSTRTHKRYIEFNPGIKLSLPDSQFDHAGSGGMSLARHSL